jgi:hypothetical protein
MAVDLGAVMMIVDGVGVMPMDVLLWQQPFAAEHERAEEREPSSLDRTTHVGIIRAGHRHRQIKPTSG